MTVKNSGVDIVLVGGGSGGHITPLLAVADSIKESSPDIRVGIIGQKGEDLAGVLDHKSVDQVYSISAGKFRRYHGESILSQIADLKTVTLNIRDFFRFLVGTYQSWRLLKKIKPQSIFLKGGFVSVPVGFAAKRLKIPYITHDSDAIPGMANRLTAKHAIFNATALPTENYPYEEEKSRMVGIPLRSDFVSVDKSLQDKYRRQLGIPASSPVIFCTGGGNGAKSLNDDFVEVVEKLYKELPDLHVLHVAGNKLQSEVRDLYDTSLSAANSQKVQVFGFYNDLHILSGSADVLVARGGATNIAEFSVQGKACVIVPSPFLTGGQQLHNAKVLTDNKAAVVVADRDIGGLYTNSLDLLKSEPRRRGYATRISRLGVSEASDKISDLLLSIRKTDEI